MNTEPMLVAFGTFGLVCLLVGVILVAFGKSITHSK